MAVRKDPRTIETAEPFRSLFPVDATTLALVTESMREHGFDATKPLLAWKDAFGERGRQVLVDGHTRLQGALDLKLPEVWVTVRQFKNLDAAITAGIGEQVQRRNLNREQIAAYVVALLPMLDETRDGLRTRTSKQLAALLGVSVPTVDRARGVLRFGDEELIADVKEGRMSLLAAYDITTGRAANPSSTGNPRGSNIMTAEEAIRLGGDRVLTAEEAERLRAEAEHADEALAPEANDVESADEPMKPAPSAAVIEYGPVEWVGWINDEVRHVREIDAFIVGEHGRDEPWYPHLRELFDNAVRELEAAREFMADVAGINDDRG